MEWKTIKGFSNYEISDVGTVRKKDGRSIKVRRDWNGYNTAFIKGDDGVWHTIRIARTMLLSFNPPTGNTKTTYVDHVNMNRSDDRLSNLRWANASENSNYSVQFNPGRHDRHPYERAVISKVLATGEEYYHESIKDAALAARDAAGSKSLDHTARAYVWYALNGRFKRAYGRTYRYASAQEIIKFNNR